MMLASQSTRMAIAASPAPRKMAFTTKSTMIAASPPSMIVA